jgi:predicted ArsR family transcriptional regulator
MLQYPEYIPIAIESNEKFYCIKAVLLKNEGWKNKAIAEALRIHKETVRQH